MRVKQYIFSLTFFLALFLLIAGGINYFVNPYLVFKDRRIEGLNYYKSDINNYVRLAKAYHPVNQNQNYEILLVGNSRMEMGLDPQHDYLDNKTYNLGIPGAGLELQIAYALNLSRVNDSVKTMIMSVDFVNFLPSSNNNTPSSEFTHSGQNRLQYFIEGTLNKDFKWNRLKDVYRSLFSLDALLSSIKTLLNQSSMSTTRTYQGFNPAFDLAEATSIEGPHRIFSQKISDLRKSLKAKGNYRGNTINEQTLQFRSLDEIIEFSIEQNIELVFFESPLHQEYMNIIDELGYSDDYRQWQLDIKNFIARKNNEKIRFIELEFPTSIIDEEIPGEGVRTLTQWFWEPSHYKKELGDKILDLIFTLEGESPGH